MQNSDQNLTVLGRIQNWIFQCKLCVKHLVHISYVCTMWWIRYINMFRKKMCVTIWSATFRKSTCCPDKGFMDGINSICAYKRFVIIICNQYFQSRCSLIKLYGYYSTDVVTVNVWDLLTYSACTSAWQHGDKSYCLIQLDDWSLYSGMLSLLIALPASQRTHDLIITSSLSQNDVATSCWRINDVIFRHVSAGCCHYHRCCFHCRHWHTQPPLTLSLPLPAYL